MRKAALILGGLVVVLVIAVAVLPRVIGLNSFKPQIADAVRDATGRELRIDGDIGLAVLPGVELSLSDVALSNADWAKEPNMVTLGSVDVKLGLLSLLGGGVEVERLIIREPAVYLEQDAQGRGSWEFETAQTAEPEPAAEEGSGRVGNISLGDVRVEGGRLSFVSAASGQEITVDALNLKAVLPNIDSALDLDGALVLNGQDVKLDVSLETPGQAMRQEAFAVAAELTSALLATGYVGTVQQQPVPGLDGRLNVDITSVGELAAWLGQPLDPAQPDPGPLNVAAVFSADGQIVTLQEATVAGDSLDLKATGSFDGSGDVRKLVLDVESGLLDIDRYLPPPADRPAEGAAAPAEEPADARAEQPGDMLAGLSDEPLDLSILKETEADIKVSLAGIKAAGFEVGRLAFNTALKGGVLAAELSELALYGGNVTGRVDLDGAAEALKADVALNIDKVDVGALGAALPEPPPVGGVASGDLTASAAGASPRALVESLAGKLAFDLGGLDIQNEQAAALSDLKLAVDLPGLEAPPTLDADLVYNGEAVALDAGLAPLGEVLSGEPFDARFKLASALVTAAYEGRVQQQPVPGLDGRFDLDVGSVGKLAAWLGQPLEDSQPDPGPLKVSAVFTADGQKATLEEATIEGEALQAQASGSFDGSEAVKKIVLKVESGLLDIDRYLPPPTDRAAEDAAASGPAAAPAAPPTADDMLAGLPDEPLDLSALKETEADIQIALGGIKAAGFEVGRVALTTLLQGGVLDAKLSELALYGGNVTGSLGLDGSGDALGADVALTIDQVDVGALAAAAATDDAPVAGVASGSLEAQTNGASVRALVEGLKASLAFDLGGIEIDNEQAAALSGLKLQANLPGLEAAPSLEADLVYNQQPVAIDLGLAPLRQMLSGDPFALTAKIASALVTAGYDGTLQQQPVPGLDGRFDLDVGSVGQLAAWLGQPLPEEQPDPGPLKIAAVFAADGAKVALTEARLDGKALKATATGSYDGSAEIARFKADVNVEQLDVDAYLPPPAEEETAAAETGSEDSGGTDSAGGWSEEPLDLSALHQANGDVKIATGPVTYRGLTIAKSLATLLLEGGVAKLGLQDLQLAEGSIVAAATVDGSGKDAALDYSATIQGVQAEPLLTAFGGIDWLSGTMNVTTKGKASGQSQKQLVETLNGDGNIQFLDGAIEGINIAETLRNAQNLNFGDSGGGVQKTDFSELSGSFVITNGVVDNQDFKMLAPLVRLSGAGQVPMPPQTVDYGVEAKLVASLEGQGGDDSLAGLPIPIRIEGTWADPSYDVDWESVFQEAALDPSRLANMPDNLKDAAKGFGVDLSIPGGLPGAEGLGEGLGETLQGITGGGGEAGKEAPGGAATGALEGLQKLIEPGASEEAPPAAESEPQPEPEVQPEELIEKPLDAIKGLFGD